MQDFQNSKIKRYTLKTWIINKLDNYFDQEVMHNPILNDLLVWNVGSYKTNQLSPRHKPSLTPLWMTVCWFCSLLFTSVEFAHQRKLSTQKYSRWTQKEWENTVKCQLREKFVLCTQEFVKGFVQAKGNYIYELQLIHTRHEVTQDLLCSS